MKNRFFGKLIIRFPDEYVETIILKEKNEAKFLQLIIDSIYESSKAMPSGIVSFEYLGDFKPKVKALIDKFYDTLGCKDVTSKFSVGKPLERDYSR